MGKERKIMNPILTLKEIEARTPSVFADTPAEEVSSRYKLIPTIEIVRQMMNEGWGITRAQQQAVRDVNKQNSTKHMLRFRRIDMKEPELDGLIPEVVLFNAHNGKLSYRLMAGIFRLVCSNGMVVAAGGEMEIRVRHTADPAEVIRASNDIFHHAEDTIKRIPLFQNRILTNDEQLQFAERALFLRYKHIPREDWPVRPVILNKAIRMKDEGDDLWHTFNRVQGNLLNGGIRDTALPTIGKSTTGEIRRIHRAIRPVRAITTDIKLNRSLWKLTEDALLRPQS